ncbi:DUF4352 domain-containing protein [Spongiactinospora sp. TRM90649]|uniref:DUF4352 domain-containing protein n=1 Tax=Spongiactinospora sp. TRM90649 TaxID=3031114 RepID=UPI0023F7B151|nr:DUF4352 domain-containing protein [Spongiactinospora sp. TRM90649]MDF5753063.1 DUF4352 domain-containing protein [Spongiactinospora sp. TRM90649]
MLAIGIPILILGGCVATIAAIGSSSTGTTDERVRLIPDKANPATLAPPPSAEPPATQPPATQPPAEEDEENRVAKVGETLIVKGFRRDAVVAVTVNRIIDAATPNNRFLQPKDGARYVAVELTLKNVGQEVYTGSPFISTELIDTEGQQHTPTFADVEEGVSFGGSVTISKGDFRKGIVVFDVPRESKPGKLQFGMTFGDQKGEWRLD